MISYYATKQELYSYIDGLREGVWSVREGDCYLDAVELCLRMEGLAVASAPFASNDLRGMAVLAEDESQNDVILLNSRLSKAEQNFFCGHELVHLYGHRGLHGRQFNCYSKVMPNQDPIIEWQANEGSAELLVPYRQFLPFLKNYALEFDSWGGIECFKWFAAKRFFVTAAVIDIRLESLKYEIAQYLAGTGLEGIKILSNKQQSLDGISVKSINNLQVTLFPARKEKPNLVDIERGRGE